LKSLWFLAVLFATVLSFGLRGGAVVATATATAAAAAAAAAADLPQPVSDADFRQHPDGLRKLGQMLFYDRILSGTYRVSCATCHNPDRASSNGFLTSPTDEISEDSLAINGLPLYDALKPSAKHAPPLFNLGAKQFVTLFGDGRVARDDKGGFISLVGDRLPKGLADVLAVQSLFPTVTGDELIGVVDNDIKTASEIGERAVWQALVKRIQDLPGYAPLISNAFPGMKDPTELTIAHIGNALSAFVASEWRSDNAPFDAYLKGDQAALTGQQQRGMDLFYGKAKCSQCHKGAFQTDHRFYNVASPLWRFDAELPLDESLFFRDRSDFSGKSEDRFRRRTPSLRNVTVTAPYGHAGSFETLKQFLKHHLDPVSGMARLSGKGAGNMGLDDELKKIVLAMTQTVDLKPVDLTSKEFNALLSFLGALTDEQSIGGQLGRPKEVPSFLALD